MINRNLLASLFALAAMCGSALAQSAAPPAGPASPVSTEDHAGFIKSVQGTAHLLGANDAARPVRAGDRIGQVDRIVTEANSGVSLVLRDGTTIVVGPSSRLDVKEFHFDSTTQDGGLLVSLLRGSLRMITGLIGKTNPDAVRIETQTATIGIRGTDFIVRSDMQQ